MVVMKEVNSTSEHLHSSALSIAVIVFGCLCIILGIIGNLGVIIYNVFMNHSKTPTTYFVVSLAIGDILVCATFFPAWIIDYTHKLVDTENGRILFCKIWITCSGTSMALSVTNLLAITIDRYIFILRPLRYPMIMTWPRTYLILIVGWFLAIINANVLFFYTNDSSELHYCKTHFLVGTIIFVFNFSLPTAALLVFNYKIFKVASNQRRKISTRLSSVNSVASNSGTPATSSLDSKMTLSCRSGRMRQQIKIIKIYAIVIGVFFLFSAIPTTILTFVNFFYCGETNCVPFHLQVVAEMLMGANSVLNPFIYGIRQKEYRNGFRQWFSKLCNT